VSSPGARAVNSRPRVLLGASCQRKRCLPDMRARVSPPIAPPFRALSGPAMRFGSFAPSPESAAPMGTILGTNSRKQAQMDAEGRKRVSPERPKPQRDAKRRKETQRSGQNCKTAIRGFDSRPGLYVTQRLTKPEAIGSRSLRL
jgi:hypothetical protein